MKDCFIGHVNMLHYDEYYYIRIVGNIHHQESFLEAV